MINLTITGESPDEVRNQIMELIGAKIVPTEAVLDEPVPALKPVGTVPETVPAPPVAETVPAPPAETVPAPPVAETADVPTSDVDSAGIPWDARIHSSGKTTVKSGEWTKKRGVTPEILAEVEAELLGKDVPDTAITEPQVGGVIPTPDNMPTSTIPAPPAETADVPTSEDVQKLLGELMNSGKLLASDMMELLSRHGVPNMMVLNDHTDKIPAIMTELEAL